MIRARYLSTLFLLLLVPAQGLALPDTIESGPRGNNRVEKYRYEAIPEGRQNDKEEIELTFSFEEKGTEYASTIGLCKVG